MELHADLKRTAVVYADALPWEPSPMPGVERRRIARAGGEVARATSLVRYAPGSRFEAHTHGGGEEYLVLSGTFSDASGDHTAGTWVRNGVGSRHAPYTKDGCIILVKLWWMHPDETDSDRVDTTDTTWVAEGGLMRVPLHQGPYDTTELVSLKASQTVRLDGQGGVEVFVVSGRVSVDETTLPRWGWLRAPGPGALYVYADTASTLFVKRGHLASPPPLPGA